VQKENPFTANQRLVALRRYLIVAYQTLCTAAAAAAVLLPSEAARIAAWLSMGLASAMFIVVVRMCQSYIAESVQQGAVYTDAQEAKLQIEELFQMTDMLQAAENHEDAGAVLMATARRLLPEFGGALYVFNNSRDRLDLATFWNAGDNFRPSETLLPNNCWALKRGKPHINDTTTDTLSCMHQIGAAATVEVPMMARGQVHGLLVLACDGGPAYDRLYSVRRVARALADAISLTLSSIALREKLRTQSLRDPLTGLYNRRYMEDALERYISLAERSGEATSVLMIDLDNFKRLNDEHGHSKGDAVLRDVANQLTASLRPSDVVARYGGEELVVILPNCGLDDACLKAEMLRARIEGLSDAHGVSVSASFGAASVPEAATSASDVIPIADGALYAAKKAGKNCVVPAEKRSEREDRPVPRLTVTG